MLIILLELSQTKSNYYDFNKIFILNLNWIFDELKFIYNNLKEIIGFNL